MPDANLMPRWSYRSAVMSPASGLSPSARLVLVALDNYRSDKSPCPFPSQQALADDTGMSPRTVRTALVEAVHAGFCERQARGSAQGGRTTDSYRLILPVRFVADFAANMGSNRQKTSGLVADFASGIVKEVVQQTTAIGAGAPRSKETVTRKAQAETVFCYWRDSLGKPDTTVLDLKRENRIMARLKENGGDASELLYAVDGALKDDWLMGREPTSKRRFDDVAHIFRDRDQIERLAAMGGLNGKPHPYLESA